MISVSLDLDSLKELTNEIQKNVLIEYVDQIHSKWVELARASAKSNYVDSIKVEQVNELEFVLGLDNSLAEMMEFGSPSFDMKDGFSKSSKVKQGKRGWYLIIPFKYATRTGQQNSRQVMPRSVYESIRREKDKKLRNIPKKYSAPKTNPTSGYQHKTSQYKGLQKRDTGYMNFRIVSANSDPNSWIHPGFNPLNLLQQAIDSVDINQIANNTI